MSREGKDWLALSVQVYFGLRDASRRVAVDVVPPLLTAHIASGDTQATVTGPWVSASDERAGASLSGLAPLFLSYAQGDDGALLTPVGAWWHQQDRHRGVASTVERDRAPVVFGQARPHAFAQRVVEQDRLGTHHRPAQPR